MRLGSFKNCKNFNEMSKEEANKRKEKNMRLE